MELVGGVLESDLSSGRCFFARSHLFSVLVWTLYRLLGRLGGRAEGRRDGRLWRRSVHCPTAQSNRRLRRDGAGLHADVRVAYGVRGEKSWNGSRQAVCRKDYYSRRRAGREHSQHEKDD